MRCPEMLIIQKMAYTRGCRVYRQRGDTCVLFVRPDRAAESPNIGRKWRARARQLSSECVCPRKSWILKSREGGERRAVGRRRDVEFKMLLCLPLSEQPCLIHGFWAGRKSSIVGSGRPRKPEKPWATIVGEGDFRIPNCCRAVVLLRIGLGGCFLVQPVLQDEPRRSNGVWRPSLAEHRPKTGTNHNSELPMNR